MDQGGEWVKLTCGRDGMHVVSGRSMWRRAWNTIIELTYNITSHDEAPRPWPQSATGFRGHKVRAWLEASKCPGKLPKEEIYGDHRIDSENGVGLNFCVFPPYGTQRPMPRILGGKDYLEAAMVSRSLRVSLTDHIFPETEDPRVILAVRNLRLSGGSTFGLVLASDIRVTGVTQ